jgi:hypothetical protein
VLVPRHLTICLFLACVLCLVACSTGPEATITIHESPQASVYLQRSADRSFQAAHPIKIKADTVGLVLGGVLVRENQDVRRAFSASDVGYLAPLLSEGLRRATSDQQVAFRLSNGVGGASSSGRSSMLASGQTIAGVAYAYGQSLYLTLSEYRPNPRSPNTVHYSILFVPESARRPDSYLDTRSTGTTLVIDYQLLAELPPTSVPTASAQSTPPKILPQTEIGSQAIPAGKEDEIEALRKELREIKKQLAEQEAERARSQQKDAVPQQ